MLCVNLRQHSGEDKKEPVSKVRQPQLQLDRKDWNCFFTRMLQRENKRRLRAAKWGGLLTSNLPSPLFAKNTHFYTPPPVCSHLRNCLGCEALALTITRPQTDV